VPVSLVAFSAGFLTGISRAPAVGTVLPAILTLVAGLGVYVFGTDNRYKVVVGYCVSILIVMLFVGMQTGAFQREGQHEAYLKYLSQQEFRIRSYRLLLDLPPEMPSWILGSVSGAK